MSRHFRAAMVGSLLVLSMAPGGFCPRSALAQDKGQVLKIEGDLKTMQGQWISKDGQAGESVWNFKEEHVSLKTPTRAYEMSIKLNPKGEPEKHIDFDVSEKSPNAKGYKAQGIYKFTGDGTLKICYVAGDSGRTKECKTEIGKACNKDCE